MDEALLNFSRVEEDPFADVPLDTNVTETTFYQRSTISLVLSYVFLFAELANFFLGIASVVSDFLLIYFIFRYKRLRSSLNLCIANYATMNLCYYVIAPILLIIHVLFSTGHSSFYFMFCYVTTIENTCLICSFLMIMLLGLEWTISVVKPHLLLKSPAIVRHKYLIIYMLIPFFLILSFFGCFYQIELLQSLSFDFMPFIVFSLIYMHYVRRKTVLNEEQLKTEYAIWIFTIAVGCFVPIYLLDLLLTIVGSHINHTLTMIIFALEYILAFLSTPSPVFILCYLLKWNKHFKMAFDTTFKRSVRNYGADNLDDASDNEDIVQDEGQKPVEIDTNGFSRSDIMVL